MRKIYFSFSFLFCAVTSFSQLSDFYSLNRDNQLFFDQELNSNNEFHSSFKPYLTKDIQRSLNQKIDSFFYTPEQHKSWFAKKMFAEHFITVDTSNLHLTVNPVYDLRMGIELVDMDNTFEFGRGIKIDGNIGDKLSFVTYFLEYQGKFPNYFDQLIDSTEVISGRGRVKSFLGAKDYSVPVGYLSYSPNEHFNFQFGQDKNFIGDGYRSLLLSDQSFSYPFLKITTNFGRFKYHNLYTSFVNFFPGAPRNYTSGYQRKSASFHYLSVNFAKRMQLGVFEGVIWDATDRIIDISYLNPIIFFRPVEFGLGSPDNSILGLNYKYNIHKNLVFYSQMVLDDIRAGSGLNSGALSNKWGVQAGLKAYIKKIRLQLEYNRVRPYVYGHAVTTQTYTHNGEAIAHPLGANFEEALFMADYNLDKKYQVSFKFQYSSQGMDEPKTDSTTTNWGQNIFLSGSTAERGGLASLGNFTGQGQTKKVNLMGIEIKRFFNPKVRSNVFVGYMYRNQTTVSNPNLETNYFYFGLRTSIFNTYNDY